ncbi:hypothetical protein HanRHA438_Chr15g0689661 [Helianthus annuus]|nr:hypothetical protein HanRHA438_Chr15g0689661 [Helianthus annuus]
MLCSRVYQMSKSVTHDLGYVAHDTMMISHRPIHACKIIQLHSVSYDYIQSHTSCQQLIVFT